MIRDVIQELRTAATCITFKEIPDKDTKSYKDDNQDHIKFTTRGDKSQLSDGCWSYVGKRGGEQVIF